MNQRPLVCGVFVFVIGQLIGMKSGMAMGLAVPALIYVIWNWRSHKVRVFKKGSFFYWSMGVFLILGIINGLRLDIHDPFLNYVDDQNQTGKLYMNVSGTVERIEQREEYEILLLQSDYFSDDSGVYHKSYHIRVYLRNSNGNIMIGDRLMCNMQLVLPASPTNPGEFDSAVYYRARGISLIGYADAYNKQKRNGGRLRQALCQFQSQAGLAYDEALELEQAGIMKTILLGMSGDLSSDIRNLYQRNGIAHILAISALHITILGSTLYKLLRKIGISYYVAGIPVIILLLAYGWMTGYSGSAIRAIIMFVMLLVGDMIGRTYDILTATGTACLYMLIEYPMRIRDAAFLLSFSAVITLGLIAPKCYEWIRELQSWKKTLISGILIQMITAPVILHYYYEFPIYAWLLNLIVIPLMTPLMICGIAGTLIYMIYPELGTIIMQPCGWILNIYTWLCEHIERLPYAVLSVGEYPVWKIMLYYTILILIYEMIRYRHRLGIIIAVLSYAGILWLSDPADLTITMLDIGQGDAILMELPDHTMILIDGGSSSRTSIGQYIISPAVKYYGSHEIDYVFVSHMDQDHVNGIMELIESGNPGDVTIQNLILPKLAAADGSFAPLISAAQKADIPIYLFGENEILEMDEVTFQCLYPGDRDTALNDKNNNSMVISLSYHDFHMLFTGDLEEEGERILMERQELTYYDVLKVGHHGSSGATSEPFLQKIRPRLAILSCGKNNPYGHPHPEAIERLEHTGADIYRTDMEGAIILHINDRKIRIEGYCGT